MKIVSEILGHSTITITADLYTHVLADSKKIAANQLSDFVFCLGIGQVRITLKRGLLK